LIGSADLMLEVAMVGLNLFSEEQKGI